MPDERREAGVYGMTLYGHGDQVRAIVRARSKAEAARLFGVSMYEFKRMAAATGNDEECRVATDVPLVRPLDTRGEGGWQPLVVES